MADSYSESGTEASDPFFDDRKLKLLGVVISGAFALTVAAFLAAVITLQVNFGLFVEIIRPQFVD
ncbi:MAG: amino acid ABC transporter permease, partial [Halobacteriales archaeon SW_9_67_24]